MRKLLSANFRRLRKSKLFWLAAAFMFAISVFALINQYITGLEYGSTITLDNFIFGYSLIIGIFMAVFCSLFFGTEYSDGTIRNKLIVGHTRISIYFATLVTSIAAALFMCLAFLAAVCAVGIPLFGFLTIGLAPFAEILLGSILMISAVCAILTALNMLVTSKAIVAIVSVLGMILLLVFAINIESRLEEPEFYSSYAVLTDGEVTISEDPTPNPNYLTDTKRVVYETIYDILPTGQALQFSRMEAAHLWQMMLYSLAIVIISTGLGVPIFTKKDLK